MKCVHHKLRNVIQSNDVTGDTRLPADPWDPGRSHAADPLCHGSTHQHMSPSLSLCISVLRRCGSVRVQIRTGSKVCVEIRLLKHLASFRR